MVCDYVPVGASRLPPWWAFLSVRLVRDRNYVLALLLGATPLLSASVARAELGDGRVLERKLKAADLDVPVERYTLPNGLTVVLNPDPNATEVLVDVAFRAGTLFEPPGKNGMAHFIEHMLMTGTSSSTDYAGMLEAAGDRGFNAFTGAERMVFRSIVPPTAVELALWVQADRLGTLPGTWSAASLSHHQRVVEVERLWRDVDVHFGAVDGWVRGRMFPAPHPLSKGISGDPKTLKTVSLADVQAFVKTHMSPANGVLVVVGAFEPAKVRPMIDRTLGALPPGEAPRSLTVAVKPGKGKTVSAKEKRSRRPRVSFVWRLPGLGEADAVGLQLGARLMESYIDGAFGTRVSAWVEQYPGGGTFRLDLTLPYDKPIDAAQSEADALLRYLTGVDMPEDVFAATRVQMDRGALLALSTLEGRGQILGWAELAHGASENVGKLLSRHWSFTRNGIKHLAWKTLNVGPPKLIVHARPVRPLAPKLHWEDRAELEEDSP